MTRHSSALKVIVAVIMLLSFPFSSHALQAGHGVGDKSPEWKEQAEVLFEMADWQRFFDWCLEWTESEPEDANAWLNLGNAHIRFKRHDEAMRAFREAVRLDPELAYCKCE